ncbi:MAG: alpha/beta fold hydrolase [Actinomycetota bacterium]|nr:alpha/beta fold hydrolase [Actinomycetota bacterium]
MPLSDMSLADLQAYRYPRSSPEDLEQFWADTLTESRAAGGELTIQPADTAVTAFDISDVTFPGFNGEPIRAWWTRPKGITDDLPVVVEYIGYGGGRGLPHERMLWAAHGYQQLVVDSRGQGSMHMTGDTPDPHGSGPAATGFLTKGVDSPENLYYRRLFTDAALAVDAARTLPGVRADRVAVWGHSQGGAMALAAAALVPDVVACAARTPFMCGIDRSAEISSTGPFSEVVNFQATHRDWGTRALDNLAYVDCALLASLIRCPVWVCVALMDTVCPPSGIYGAINNMMVQPEVVVRAFNGHEGGASFDEAELGPWFAERLRG